MPKPIWQQKLQAKLDSNPLFFRVEPNFQHVIKCEKCFAPSEKKGKRVSLRECVNYSFNTCSVCKKEYH